MNIEHYQTAPSTTSDKDYPWINPIGGLGDILMLSSILKLLFDKDPTVRFNLVRRTRYQSILRGHPAINLIGHPPSHVECLKNNYWAMEELGPGDKRAFQVLARAFGLSTPVPENLYMPGVTDDDPMLWNIIQSTKRTVVIAPYSDSPRKAAHPSFWIELVEKLVENNIQVLQVGRSGDYYIKGAFSLIGITSPRQIVALLKRCDIAVTSDNFIMHAARCANKPAVVLWGPTDKNVYGYDTHIHFQGESDICPLKKTCIGARFPQNYTTPCPRNEDHCMNGFKVDNIVESVLNTLKHVNGRIS